MSAELVMAGPGQPVTHDSRHDLESLFYVLTGLCVLLDEPFKFKCDDDLSQCFDKLFNTFEPSVLKTITIQSNLTWLPMILAHLSPFFQPLVPLLTRLREDIILPMYTNDKGDFCCKKPLSHKILIDAVIESLLSLDDDAWKPYSCPDAGGDGWDDFLPGDDSTSDDDKSEGHSEYGSGNMLVEEGSEKVSEEFTALLEPVANSPQDDLPPNYNESHSPSPVTDDVRGWPIVRPPPNTTGPSTCRSSHSHVLSDSFMRVRRQTLDDTPEHHANPRVKRARSSSKNTNDPARCSTRSHAMPIKSTSSAPRRSTRTSRRTDRSR